MPDIFCVHKQMDFLVNRDSHFGSYNIVPGFDVMLGIEAENILRALINEFWMQGSKLFIRTRVAEIKSELSGLRLDGHCRGGRRREIDVSPCFHSKDAKRQNFRPYKQNGTDYQALSAPGKRFKRCFRTAV